MVCPCSSYNTDYNTQRAPANVFADVLHEFKTQVIIQNHETDKFTNIFNSTENLGHYWGGRYGADYESVDGVQYMQIQTQFCETCGNIEQCRIFLNDTIKCKCNGELLE